MTENPQLQQQAQGLINRAQAIIMKPVETWPIIAKETDEPMQVFMRYVLPLAAIGPVAALIGGQVFGYGAFGFSYRPGFTGAITTAVLTYALALVGVWIIAFAANFLSPKFAGKDDFPAAFRLTAYSMTASWLAGIFGLIPALGILGLVGLYSLYLFYKGAPTMMAVPEDKAVGYTAVTVLIALVINFVFSAIVGAILGAAALTGAVGSGTDGSSDNATIDLGEYGSIEVDGDQQNIDLGEMGQAKINTETGEMTINVDGKEVKVTVPTEKEANGE